MASRGTKVPADSGDSTEAAGSVKSAPGAVSSRGANSEVNNLANDTLDGAIDITSAWNTIGDYDFGRTEGTPQRSTARTTPPGAGVSPDPSTLTRFVGSGTSSQVND